MTLALRVLQVKTFSAEIELMRDGGKAAVEAGDQVVVAAELRSPKKYVRDLERLLRRKTMEVEIFLRTRGRAWDFQGRALSAGARGIGHQETEPILKRTDVAGSSSAAAVGPRQT